VARKTGSVSVLIVAATIALILGIRVLVRMVRSAGGSPLSADPPAGAAGLVSAIVPVLNEEARVGAALEALCACGPELREILVVDGGSRDATAQVVAAAALRDPRIRWIDAAPVPADWNGKAWGIACGLRAASAEAEFVATIDADVRVSPRLFAAMLAKRAAEDLTALSVATKQELGDWLEGLLHPAFLCTLVYRFGLPGVRARDIGGVQANGQCFLARRETLLATDAVGLARDSRCEDVTIARALVARGYGVGFYEGEDAVTVRMYANGTELWRNWPRSLPMRDRFAGPAWGLAEVIFVQALPLPLAIVFALAGAATPLAHAAFSVSAGLVMMRLGTLAGMRRAYAHPPLTYWLSPLADLAVAYALLASVLRRTYAWRGRTLVAEHGA
jgi:dolichol-phosphate mannosyltransferase